MQIICVSGSSLLVRIQFAYHFSKHVQDGGVYPVFHYVMHEPFDAMVREVENRMEQYNGKGYFLALAASQDHSAEMRDYGCKSVYILDACSLARELVKISRWDIVVPTSGRIEDHARTLAEGVALL